MRFRSAVLMFAVAPPLVFSACTPHGAPKGPDAAASASATAVAKHHREGDDDESLQRDDDGLPKAKKAEAKPAAPPPRVGLAGGLAALDAAEYAAAERELTKAAQNKPERGAALVGLARTFLETGRLPEAIKTADQAAQEGKEWKIAAAPVKARAQLRTGKLADAEKTLKDVENEPEARRARLVLGELLIREGQRSSASAPLMTLIEDFNKKVIKTTDGEGMLLVGRAAQLLRSPHDANDAFDDAEKAGLQTPELFLARARLFLAAENIGRAEEMVREALKRAPELAEAHLLMGEVRLEQTLDFDAADKAAQRALAVDKQLPGVFFLRAGIALRDMEIGDADKLLAEGLAIDPKDLDLLSLKAAVRFLADDKAGFTQTVQQVLALNGEYARLYQIISEFADWEHRYVEIVAMMKDAVRVDPDDGKSWVTLGLNQIRLGTEDDGVKSLDIGFRKDKFNVRAFNTLNLYEDTIPKKYESITHGPFVIRVPKDEKAILERYVPALLDDAWASMTKRYGFTPTTPVGIELYGSRQDFSVRTSGLPNVGIQGVCFGQTLAAISPKPEPFNWGNVVWHEVGHIFAIQLSKSHVPRWFTEGLSEYETLARRPEWRREEDVSLWLALKHDRIPTVERFNRAFTHAEDISDMTTAYYAASQIAVYLEKKYGQAKMNAMLTAWGQGKRTPEVIQATLGISAADLDKEFRAFVNTDLIRYNNQFVPDLRAPKIEEAEAAATKNPKDAKTQVELALARIADGDGDGAIVALDAAQAIDEKFPDARFLRAKLDLRRKKVPDAKKQLEAMTAEGHDGFAVRMMLADIADAGSKDKTAVKAEFEKASALDPSQSEPLEALADIARKAGDTDGELAVLRRLALVDQHDRRVWRRLLADLVGKKLWAEAMKVGESAMFVDVHGAETHTLYAEALFGGGDVSKAKFEAESALLCDKLKADIAGRANVVLAKVAAKTGDAGKAATFKAEALRQDPDNAEAQALP